MAGSPVVGVGRLECDTSSSWASLLELGLLNAYNGAGDNCLGSIVDDTQLEEDVLAAISSDLMALDCTGDRETTRDTESDFWRHFLERLLPLIAVCFIVNDLSVSE